MSKKKPTKELYLSLLLGATCFMAQNFLEKTLLQLKKQKLIASSVVDLEAFRNLKNIRPQKNLLVVDDDEGVRHGLKRMLDPYDYQVFLAEDGLTLSRVLETTQIDLIILDVGLPWVDGFEICETLKKHAHFASLPIILLSGRGSLEDRQRGMAAGALKYLSKPFDKEHILEAIEACFVSG